MTGTPNKSTGIGARLYVGGYDISGDTQTFSVTGGIATLDVTDITQSAHSRLGGLRDGTIDATVFFDYTGVHVEASALPVADEIFTVLIAPLSVGGAGACLNARQIGYDPTRDTAGMLTLKTQGVGDAYGLEWGVQLTPGLRTDTEATDGDSFDNGGALAFGAQAYLQASALDGTDVTVTVQHSADDSTWADLMAFDEIVSGNGNLPPSAQRISVGNTTTVDEYLRVITTTSGGFTSFSFVVVVNVNQVAGVVF